MVNTSFEQETLDVFIRIAELAHETNRVYCQSQGDTTQPPWNEAPEWQKKSALNGVIFHLQNPGANASASHDNWLKEKIADGWIWGPEKDPDVKQHPCVVPYEKLPVAQQTKDHIFRSVVHAAARIFQNVADV